MLLLLPPASLTWDTQAQPPWFEVRSAITIAATPEQVWKHMVAFPDLPEPTEWYFHTGVAYPVGTRIVGSGVGAARYCELSTGPVVETIEAWDQPRLLRFRVTETPAPMRETMLYGTAEPKHLHGYMVSKEGEFEFDALAQRTHAGGGNVVVSARTLARGILALVVGRNRSSDSWARAESHPDAGGSGARSW